jgi:hypothetical protein
MIQAPENHARIRGRLSVGPLVRIHSCGKAPFESRGDRIIHAVAFAKLVRIAAVFLVGVAVATRVGASGVIVIYCLANVELTSYFQEENGASFSASRQLVFCL